MTRRVLIAVWAVLAGVAAAGVIWFYAAGNVGDPTAVTAPVITAAGEATPTHSTTPDTAAAITTESSAPPTTTSGGEGEDSEETVAAGSAETGDERMPEPEEEEPEGEAEVDDTVELLLGEGSEARFLIYEDLRGEPFTVVGATNEVVGRIEVDRADLTQSRMGEILINARTFATDSSNRDRAIRGPILNAEQYEFITFRPISIGGLSGAAEPGQEWSFVVEGDLVVRDISRPVAFEVTARWEDGDVLEGEAQATVLRSDFDLSVPSVPFVANVADEVGLELDFIARPGG